MRQDGGRDIADIAVALGLDPGPAFGFVEDRDIVAEQQLRVEAGIGARRLANIGDGGGDPRRPACHEAGGRTSPAAGRRRDRAEGVQADPWSQIGIGQMRSDRQFCALAMIPSPKRST